MIFGALEILRKLVLWGKKYDFFQEDIINMPANNFSVIYRKVD